MTDTMSIGHVAQRTGLSVHTLRFYEREGLLTSAVRRGAGGHRLYDASDLEWLEVCSKLRESGMPLAVIRQYAELVRQGDGNLPERLSLLREHQRDVRAQIAALIDCLELISFKVRLYEAYLTEGLTGDPLVSSGQIVSTAATASAR